MIKVFFGGVEVGAIDVQSQTARKLLGKFVPKEGYPRCHSVFQEAMKWSQVFDAVPPDQSVDYAAWDKYIAALEQITPQIQLEGVQAKIEEFAIDHALDVEITLVS